MSDGSIEIKMGGHEWVSEKGDLGERVIMDSGPLVMGSDSVVVEAVSEGSSALIHWMWDKRIFTWK